jgi:spermidine/putrescine transport system substrate-binding protein
MTEQDQARMLEALRTATRTGIPRRRVLQAAALGGAAIAGSPLLAACGTKGAATADGSATVAPTAEDRSDADKALNFSNWQLYIDVDEKDGNLHPTLDQFKAKTGVTVAYTEDVNDGDSFYAKIAPALRAGQDTGRDLFALPDSDAARLIRNGYVQKLDRSRTPNVAANMLDSLKGPSWDPDRAYAAPWQSGLTGIAYNAKKVPEVRTVEELFTRADLKGHVTVLTEWRDTMGLILQQLGKDAANFTDDDFGAAIDYLQKASDSGQIRQFTGNDYSSLLTNGTAYACMAWSGDIVQLQLDNPDIKFVQPESGMMIWSDEMMIPAMAQHKKNAEDLMNFYYDPTVAAQLTAYVQYICPVKGAQQEMEKIDTTLVDNELIFPTEELLKKTALFMGLDEKTGAKYGAQFAAVKTS